MDDLITQIRKAVLCNPERSPDGWCRDFASQWTGNEEDLYLIILKEMRSIQDRTHRRWKNLQPREKELIILWDKQGDIPHSEIANRLNRKSTSIGYIARQFRKTSRVKDGKLKRNVRIRLSQNESLDDFILKVRSFLNNKSRKQPAKLPGKLSYSLYDDNKRKALLTLLFEEYIPKFRKIKKESLFDPSILSINDIRYFCGPLEAWYRKNKKGSFTTIYHLLEDYDSNLPTLANFKKLFIKKDIRYTEDKAKEILINVMQAHKLDENNLNKLEISWFKRSMLERSKEWKPIDKFDQDDEHWENSSSLYRLAKIKFPNCSLMPWEFTDFKKKKNNLYFSHKCNNQARAAKWLVEKKMGFNKPSKASIDTLALSLKRKDFEQIGLGILIREYGGIKNCLYAAYDRGRWKDKAPDYSQSFDKIRNYTMPEKKQISEWFRYHCFYCGKEVNPTSRKNDDKMEAHHFYPKSNPEEIPDIYKQNPALMGICLCVDCNGQFSNSTADHDDNFLFKAMVSRLSEENIYNLPDNHVLFKYYIKAKSNK